MMNLELSQQHSVISIAVGEGKNLRWFRDEDEILWFCLTDILAAMKSSTTTTAAKRSISEVFGEGLVCNIPLQTPGGVQNIAFANESATSYLMAQSRTEEGKQMNRKIHGEILPAIRKTGRYEERPRTREDIFHDAYIESQKFLEEKQAIIDHQKQALRKSASIQLKQIGQVKKAKAAIEFVERVADHDKDLRSLSEASKILGISRPQKFNQILRDGIVFGEKDSRFHMLENKKGLKPLSKTIENGWMRIVENEIEQPDGAMRIFQQVKVTQKGIQRLHELFDLTNLPPELGQKNKSL